MPAKFENCALMKFLSKDEEYRQRVLMLRKEMSKWLQYTVATFPHYPSHAQDHSEQIVLQLSKILFRRGKSIIKELSRAEAYVLICAAFLHDSGMVLSPDEAEKIVGSGRWQQFISGKGAPLWEEIQVLRSKSDDISAYRVGLQFRLLLADYVRREHHLRSKLVLELHPALRQLVDINDRRYFEAIYAIAMGHGVNRSELNDPARFKEIVDLGGEQVNIRFMARLLRIGDLLDMRSSRADPYACSIVASLPQDSVSHWMQYSTIVHERVDADRIEYTCECQDQYTHAVLRNWFGWLDEELRQAGLEMLHAERHAGWRPPLCSIGDGVEPTHHHSSMQPTIIIKPAANATYSLDPGLNRQEVHEVAASGCVSVKEQVLARASSESRKTDVRVEAKSSSSDEGSVWLTNPFRPGPALTLPSRLLGRGAVISDLMALVESRCPALLRGPRHSGKTSIFNLLTSRLAPTRRIRHISLEGRRIVTADDLARALDSSLESELRPALAMRAQLYKEFGGAIFIDEIANLLTADSSLFAWLRSLHESTSVVLAGSHWDWVQVAERFASVPGSSFGNDLTLVTIGPLEDDDALAFLEDTAPPDVPMPSGGLGRWIIDCCGTWPFYLQVMGFAVVQAARNGDRKVLSEPEGLMELYERRLLLDRDVGFFRKRWAELPKQAQQILWDIRSDSQERLPTVRSLSGEEQKWLYDTGLCDERLHWIEDKPFYDWLYRVADDALGPHKPEKT